MPGDGYIILGLIAVAGLALIPIVMVGRIILAFIEESRRDRAAEARRVTRHVPGLGDFSSTDDELWFGESSGLHIAITSRGQPPTAQQAAQIQAIINDLEQWAGKAKEYLRSHEDCDWLEGDVARFRPCGIELEDASSFVLQLRHPEDYAVHSVTFRDGEPIAYGYDD